MGKYIPDSEHAPGRWSVAAFEKWGIGQPFTTTELGLFLLTQDTPTYWSKQSSLTAPNPNDPMAKPRNGAKKAAGRAVYNWVKCGLAEKVDKATFQFVRPPKNGVKKFSKKEAS